MAHYFTDSAENPFPADACSDHAGIQFKVLSDAGQLDCSSLNIAAWRMVKWMDFGCNDQDKKTVESPYGKTHLFENVEFGAPYSKMNAIHNRQVEEISVVLKKGGIFALQETDPVFVKALSEKLGDRFKLFHSSDVLPQDLRDKVWMMSTLVVDTDLFDVFESTCIPVVPFAKSDNPQHAKFFLPAASLKDKATGQSYFIVSVHMPGNPQQFPVDAMNALFSFVENRKQDEIAVLLGDWNTLSIKVDEVAKKFFNPDLTNSIKVDYPTHVNPNFRAVDYDSGLVYAQKPTKIEVASSEKLPPSSRLLVDAIHRSVQLAAQKGNDLRLTLKE